MLALPLIDTTRAAVKYGSTATRLLTVLRGSVHFIGRLFKREQPTKSLQNTLKPHLSSIDYLSCLVVLSAFRLQILGGYLLSSAGNLRFLALQALVALRFCGDERGVQRLHHLKALVVPAEAILAIANLNDDSRAWNNAAPLGRVEQL